MTSNKTEVTTFSKSIAFLISLYFPPEFGGGATHAWNRAMTLYKIGFSVFVITGFPTYPSGKISDSKYKGKIFYVETLDKLTVIRLRLLPIEYAGFLRRLVIFLNFIFVTIFYLPKILAMTGRNINLVYATQPPPFCSVSGFIYSKATRALFVYEAPDLWPEQLVILDTHLLPLIMFAGKLLAKIAFSLPDIIVTISEFAACHIAEVYKPRAPVYGIHPGVDINKFPEISKEDARAELIRNKILPPIIQDKFIVLYAGVISRNQRIENLAYAAAKLKDENEVAILIIGEGDEKQKLQQLKLELNIDNFYILPSQPRDAMPNIISAANICIIQLSFEKIFNVALPTKFYEYVACGRPIIGICTGELANIIRANDIGRTAEFGKIEDLVSIIKSLKNSPSLMHIMENNCHSMLQQFSLDNLASVFFSILQKRNKK